MSVQQNLVFAGLMWNTQAVVKPNNYCILMANMFFAHYVTFICTMFSILFQT